MTYDLTKLLFNGTLADMLMGSIWVNPKGTSVYRIWIIWPSCEVLSIRKGRLLIVRDKSKMTLAPRTDHKWITNSWRILRSMYKNKSLVVYQAKAKYIIMLTKSSSHKTAPVQHNVNINTRTKSTPHMVQTFCMLRHNVCFTYGTHVLYASTYCMFHIW
jgi:hypothetical protein